MLSTSILKCDSQTLHAASKRHQHFIVEGLIQFVPIQRNSQMARHQFCFAYFCMAFRMTRSESIKSFQNYSWVILNEKAGTHYGSLNLRLKESCLLFEPLLMKVESLIRIKRVLWTRHTENIETWAHQPILHRAVSVQIDS
ncbi:Hypothetical_protein [Hexamita inflata]|uniref:Hypothetical_protein n=1 Tax=Hexamita inflata TaxID=28002 RepID=A0AA86NB28_9EUKA|nr:Hypothetical protein HINF_LOCUS3997 [Hexamita inflata]